MSDKNLCQKLSLVATAFLLVTPIFAGVTYEFRQVSQSDFENGSDGEVTGTGHIDGEKSRIEIRKGAGHPPGTYIIMKDGLVFIVDPLNKKFTEIDATKIATAFGSGRIQIANLKSNLKKLNDHPIVAGLPTDHFQLTANYDITVMFGSLPLKQAVMTTIDKWVTTAFGDLTDLNAKNAARTGNAAVDQLIEAEMGKIKGFPLRQITTIQTMSMDVSANTRSKLKLRPTRKQTSELLITRIEASPSTPSMFEVPASYARVERSAQPEGPAAQMLTMQP